MQRINQRRKHRFTQATSDDADDQDSDYDSRIFPDRDAQNLRRINQRKGHCFNQALSDDEDDKDDEYDSGIIHDRNAQNLRHINQRKGHGFIQQSSADEDDVPMRTIRTMNTTAVFSMIGTHKICVVLNIEKRRYFIQAISDDEDDQDNDLIIPYTFQIFRSQVYSPKANAPVEACVPICKPFQKKSEKYQPQGIWGLNWRFERKYFSNRDMPTLCTNFAPH